MTAARHRAQQAAESLADLGAGSARQVSDRLARVRASGMLIAQSGIAAGLAWFAARAWLHHTAPVFAPISAVVVLGTAVGQRWRRAVELVLGVALGIGVGDALVRLIGNGSWQMALVVMLALSAAVFLGGGATATGQAASTAVLVTTLTPAGYFTRFTDAVTGGIVGVLVMALLLPVNPLTSVQRAARPVLELLAAELRSCADALASGDIAAARRSLTRLRNSDSRLTSFREAIGVATETASLAPVRWRARTPLGQYVDAAVPVSRAVRNARLLMRRGISAAEEDAPVPAGVIASVRTLAGAVDRLREELARGREPAGCRTDLISAVAEAADAYQTGAGLSASVVYAQVRSVAVDLLCASGLDEAAANRAVRRAAGRVRSGR